MTSTGGDDVRKNSRVSVNTYACHDTGKQDYSGGPTHACTRPCMQHRPHYLSVNDKAITHLKNKVEPDDMQNIERNETGIVEVIDAHSIPNHVVTLVQSALKYSVNKHMRKHQTTQMRVQHCK